MSEFINVMSRAVNGVSIVTTDGDLGRYGLTVSSMTSVSAEPPMLLVCVNRSSAAHDAIRDNGRFGINVLGANQHKLAAVFAGNSEYGDPYSFDRESWDLAEELPLSLPRAGIRRANESPHQAGQKPPMRAHARVMRQPAPAARVPPPLTARQRSGHPSVGRDEPALSCSPHGIIEPVPAKHHRPE